MAQKFNGINFIFLPWRAGSSLLIGLLVLAQRRQPSEPRVNLIYTFIAGMVAVPIAMVLGHLVLFQIGLTGRFFSSGRAFIEEILNIRRRQKTAALQILF